MSPRFIVAILLGLLLTAAALEPPPKEKVEKFMAAEKASALHESDNAYGQEIIATLPGLLLSDPELAKRYFLKARTQIAADRADRTVSKPGEGGARHRSTSVLGAALGAALEPVEKALKNGDERLPKTIAATVEMLAADTGWGVESNISSGTHLGWMLIKAGTGADEKFSIATLVNTMGPQLKPEWLPVLICTARGVGWNHLRNDEKQYHWLRDYDGPHKEFASLLFAGVSISMQENDAGKKTAAGILELEKLPSEQRWLIELLEKKAVPPAALYSAAAETLRVWPTAEPPLRYTCARALAAAWEVDVPVNAVEAGWILSSLAALIKDGKAPPDQEFAATAALLFKAWHRRLELIRTPLYGWRSDLLQNGGVPSNLYWIARSLNAAEADALLTHMTGEAARDRSLHTLVSLSESFQSRELYDEAAKIIASITPVQILDPEVKGDLPMHVSIKRLHLPLNSAFAGGPDAAVKATIQILTEKIDDPAAWTGAAWAWTNWGTAYRNQGNHEEALRRYCIGCILAHAADHYAPKTHGKFQPSAEADCRAQLTALKYPPSRIGILRTKEGVQTLLDSFDGAWKDLPAAVRDRLMAGAK